MVLDSDTPRSREGVSISDDADRDKRDGTVNRADDGEGGPSDKCEGIGSVVRCILRERARRLAATGAEDGVEDVREVGARRVVRGEVAGPPGKLERRSQSPLPAMAPAVDKDARALLERDGERRGRATGTRDPLEPTLVSSKLVVDKLEPALPLENKGTGIDRREVERMELIAEVHFQ